MARGNDATRLHDVRKVLAADVVVRLDKDLTQPTLPDGIVLGVELVEPVEGVAILSAATRRTTHGEQEEEEDGQDEDIHITGEWRRTDKPEL